MANKALNAVITIGGALSSSLGGAVTGARAQIGKLGQTVKAMERDQKRLGDAIDRMGGPGARGTRRLQSEFDELGRTIERTRARQDRLNRALEGVGRGRAMIASAAVGIGAIGAAAATLGVPVVHAASFETAMMGVAKQVQGARDDAGNLTPVYHEMAREIQQLGREIPIATNELAGMVEAGARMGIARENLLDFTRTTAEMATALQLPREQLADDIGKISNLFHMPIPAIRDLGDAINYLDDNTVSKGGDIIDFLQRTGGVSGSVKVTAQGMAALGSTMLSLGERSETAATSSSAFIQKLAAADKGSKKFKAAMAEIGLSASNVQKGMQEDAQATMLSVLDAVNRMPADKRLGVLVDLVGLEHSDTIAKLAVNVGEFRKQIDLANSSAAKGSMGREFAATLETTSAQFEMLKNRAFEASVNFGSVLLPAINNVMGVIGSAASGLADFTREHPVLVKNVVALAGAIGGSIAVWRGVSLGIGLVTYAFNAMKLAMMTNPIGMIAVGLATAAVLIWTNWEPIKAFFLSLWESITEGAGKAWEFVKASFLNYHPLGLVIKNWGPLSAWFGDLFAGIRRTIGSAIDWALSKIEAVGSAWKSVKGFFGGDVEPATARPGGGAGGRRPPPPPAMATARGGRGGYTDNSQTTIHVTQQPGQSGKELASEIEAKRQAGRGRRRNTKLHDGARGY